MGSTLPTWHFKLNTPVATPGLRLKAFPERVYVKTGFYSEVLSTPRLIQFRSLRPCSNGQQKKYSQSFQWEKSIEVVAVPSAEKNPEDHLGKQPNLVELRHKATSSSKALQGPINHK